MELAHELAASSDAASAAEGHSKSIKARVRRLLQEFIALARELFAALAHTAGEPTHARGINLGKKPRLPAEVCCFL